ncbi:hypothetical protein GQ457_12G014100 [Hibiscus cannabinus]
MKASIEAWEASKSKKACEEEKADSKELSYSTFSSTSFDLQKRKIVPYVVPKGTSCDDSNTSLVLRNFQQPCSPQFDVSYSFDFISPSLQSDFFGCALGCVPRTGNLVDCRDCDCSLEFKNLSSGLKLSSVETQVIVCSSFQLNEATTTSASSIQLNLALASSTSARQAQLQLTSPEAAESYPTHREGCPRHVHGMWGVRPCSRHMYSHVQCTWTNSACFENVVVHLFFPPCKWHLNG